MTEGPIAVRRVVGFDALDANAATLRLVAARLDRDLAMADPAFLRSYAQNFEYSDRPPVPEILVAERAGEAIGFLATRVGCREVLAGRFVRERTLLVTHDHDRLSLVATPADEDAVADALVADILREPGAGAIDVAGIQVGSALHRALHTQADRSLRWSCFDTAVEPFCTVPVSYESIDGYFRSLSKQMRSNVSRQARRLFATGEVRLLAARGRDEVAPLFPAFLDLEQRSWKYAAQAGVLRAPKRTAFFHDVVNGNAAYEPSMVGVTLDGELIAALLLGRFGSSMTALEMSFDEERAALGAGQLLLILGMHEAIETASSSIAFLQHFSYFKKRWLADEVAVVSTRAVKVGSPLHVRHVVAEWQRRRSSSDGAESMEAVWNNERRATTGAIGAPRLPDGDVASRALLEAGMRGGATLRGQHDAAALLPFPIA